jgi:hypothetical protein
VIRATGPSSRTARAKKPTPIDGSDQFAEAIERADERTQQSLQRLLAWASGLERRNLATLKSVLGDGRQILLVWLPGEKAGLVSIWNDGGAYISLWRSVFARHAWEQIEPIEELTEKPMGRGSTIADPTNEVLELLTAAYESANENTTQWDGNTYYVSFGDGPNRNWDDAREYGFVAAGGGAWYSKTLKQLEPGNHVFAYISKGNGVGGYVGFGEVTGPAVLAKDFVVERDGKLTPITELARADMARGGTTDPDVAEWVVPVSWIKSLPRDDAVKDTDFFANQNSAVRLTHGYTLKRLRDLFTVGPSPADATAVADA